MAELTCEALPHCVTVPPWQCQKRLRRVLTDRGVRAVIMIPAGGSQKKTHVDHLKIPLQTRIILIRVIPAFQPPMVPLPQNQIQLLEYGQPRSPPPLPLLLLGPELPAVGSVCSAEALLRLLSVSAWPTEGHLVRQAFRDPNHGSLFLQTFTVSCDASLFLMYVFLGGL